MGNYLAFFGILFSTLVGALVCIIKIKSIRLILVLFLTLALSALGVYLTLVEFTYHTLAFIFIILLQILNLFRSYVLRYEKNSARRVILTGVFLSVISLLLAIIVTSDFGQYIFSFYVIALLTFIFGLTGIYKLFKNHVNPDSVNLLSDNDLPTLSVLIPARDEDSQLADCIEAVLANDYPKLEVIVLDDCSQDKSSEIIRGFAQQGVRFIQGEQPKINWLAKNQAYEVLSKSASGDWFLFMGVDVRLGRNALKHLVSNVINKKLLMAGVMPLYKNTNISSIFYPLRFFWEMVLPYFIMQNPPAISTCWLVHDDALKSLGGFGAVSQSVLPERYFARKLNEENKYKFFKSSEQLNVVTTKSHKDQIDTSERLLFPQLKKSIARLFLMTLLVFMVLMQYFYLVSSILSKDYQIMAIILVSILPGALCQILISSFQGAQYKLLRTAFTPILLVQELALAYISAYRYEFSEVLWKGRNVCYPNLQVIHKLPKV